MGLLIPGHFQSTHFPVNHFNPLHWLHFGLRVPAVGRVTLILTPRGPSIIFTSRAPNAVLTPRKPNVAFTVD